MQLSFAEARYGDDVTTPLIGELQAEMTVRYGTPDGTPVDPVQFDPPDGTFLVARLGDDVAGCGGLRRHDERSAELKRMYVRPVHRRRGLASALLAELEARARQAGYRRVVLETGSVQPEAIALYGRHGYARITGFGHYAEAELSRSFGRDL